MCVRDQMLQAHLVPVLVQLSTSLSPYGALVPFTGAWGLETRIWELVVLIAAEVPLLLGVFSGDKCVFTYPCLSPVCVFIHSSIHPSVCLSIHLSICHLSDYLYIYLPVHLSVRLSICHPSIRPSTHHSSICPSTIHPSICPSVHPSIFLSITCHLSICICTTLNTSSPWCPLLSCGATWIIQAYP